MRQIELAKNFNESEQMKKIILVSLIIMLPVFLVAQTSVSGTVTDSKTGAPLVGANVIAEDSGGIGSTTNSDGEYSYPTGEFDGIFDTGDNIYNYAVTHVTNVSDLFNSVRNQNIECN